MLSTDNLIGRVVQDIRAEHETTAGGFRLVTEHGTHLATVSDAAEAAEARDHYAELYGCIVLVERTTEKPQRW